MAKKKKATVKWVVIDEEGYQGQRDTFNLAKELAEDCMELYGRSNVQILEVVKAWELTYPEEPLPEVRPIDLEEIDV